MAAAVRAFDNDPPDNSSTATTTETETNARGARRTTTTVAGRSTTTSRSGRSTTSVASGTNTTVAAGGGGGATATTAAPARIVDCRGNDVAYSTDTNKPAYRPADDVHISLVVHNISSVPCYVPPPCGTGPWASVENLEGSAIWRSTPNSVTCPTPAPAPPKVNPGESYSYGVVATWHQLLCTGEGCTGDHAPPGSYRAIAHRDRMNAEGATFALR